LAYTRITPGDAAWFLFNHARHAARDFGWNRE